MAVQHKARDKSIGRLHILTDFFFQQQYSHAELAALAIRGGADTIQFRDKSRWIRHKLHEARGTARICREAGVPCIVDDHADLALVVGAAGVHLGQEDLPIDAARSILGPDFIIGATVRTVDEAKEAADHGADYLGFGPVYSTRSKANPASVRGLWMLEEVCRVVPVPVIAIAGITRSRIPEVFAAGAHGVAVLSEVCTAPDPEAAARALREEINRQVPHDSA